MQEVFCANDTIVYCGRHSILWHKLVRVQEKLWDFDRELMLAFHEFPAIRSFIAYYGPYALRLVFGSIPAEPPSLYDIVLKHVSKGASDPRDKIYAFVGISKQAGTHLIDYSRSVRDVYVNFVLETISQSKSLDVICALPRLSSGSNEHDLPLWSADLSRKRAFPDQSLTTYRPINEISASDNSITQFSFDFSEGSITVQGGRLDTVQHLGIPFIIERTDDLKPALTAISNWWSLHNALKATSVESREAFARTLCRDRIGPRQYEGSSKGSLLNFILAACSYVAQQHQLDSDLHSDDLMYKFADKYDWDVEKGNAAIRWLRQISSYLQHQRLFVSSSGIIGIVQEATRKEDEVCILLGCSLPCYPTTVR